ncbi:hypothetical protein J437_LFUL000438 [Ladona fulva]|uniref:Reverse transcriptase domain-containing protein n=1 Tax=Ladona fulva TaxID=123851 RepID=A0A8K0K4J8_LADFU|nr:hypothetical protein J437_LFUL000438 [Ladona fulva]
MIPMLKTVFVKLTSAEYFEKVLDNNGGEMKFVSDNGEEGVVTIESATGRRVTVKILHVPFELGMDAIVDELKNYGKVLKCEYNSWGGEEFIPVRTGTRSVKMELKKPIPSYIYISGVRATIWYHGKLLTCSVCGSSDHLRKSCRRSGLPPLGRRYADIVDGLRSAMDDDFPALPSDKGSNEYPSGSNPVGRDDKNVSKVLEPQGKLKERSYGVAALDEERQEDAAGEGSQVPVELVLEGEMSEELEEGFLGDFNSILRDKDSTSNSTDILYPVEKGIKTMLSNMGLIDAQLHVKPQDTKFTRFGGKTASRLDRVHVSKDLLIQIINCETIPVWFSDHAAVMGKGELTLEDFETIKDIKKWLSKKHIQQNLLKYKRYSGSNRIEKEKMSVYEYASLKKRQRLQQFPCILDENGLKYTDTENVKFAIHHHFEKIFGKEVPTPLEKEYEFISPKSMLKVEEKNYLEGDINQGEMEAVVRALPNNKSPGVDGIPYEFYKTYWSIIGEEFCNVLKECFKEGRLDPEQKTGIIVLVPKIMNPQRCTDYRPVTLTTTDYKIMAKIIKGRIQSVIGNKLERENYTVCKNENIIDILTDIRDIIKISEKESAETRYIVAMDIEKAFDNILIEYIAKVLYKYAMPEKIISIIKEFNTNLKSKIKVGQDLTDYIEIKQSIRQGCPLSMLLFAIGIDPLIKRLKEKVKGIQIEGSMHHVAVYADDLTIFTTNPKEVDDLSEVFESYRRISGLNANGRKTQILRLGGKKINKTETSLPTEEVKILGIKWKNTLKDTIEINWKEKIEKLRNFYSSQRQRNSSILEKIIIINDIEKIGKGNGKNLKYMLKIGWREKTKALMWLEGLM